jgi:ABC-2 type transport system ATP-binding protein
MTTRVTRAMAEAANVAADLPASSGAPEVASGIGARAAPDDDQVIRFENVSRFYGDVLGVNRVTLTIGPGVTSLVGPNGSGKSTLMNLMTGLIRPSRGRLRVLGLSPSDPERFFRVVGYCAQFDHFPRGVTGRSFIRDSLLLQGLSPAEASQRTDEALDRVNMTEAADRKLAGHSKGMRQRVRLAQAIAHHPQVLVLDEPLNGLDPMARAETMSLLKALADDGKHVIISSHILHEVDRLSDQVVLLSHGYVVAEGQIHGVRDEVHDQPAQILVRCSEPRRLARLAFEDEAVVEARIQDDGQGLLIRTREADRFYRVLNRAVAAGEIALEAVAPADDDVGSVYQYLLGSESAGAM